MAIFNSLGSNYNFFYVVRSLLTITGSNDRKNLRKLIEKKYEGEATLLYKGREALTLALNSLNLTKDSRVAINGFTCVAVYNAIETTNLSPVCIDLDDKESLNFSPQALERAIKQDDKIKVVIIQNTLGYPCDIGKIEEICKRYKVVLIEDLAHCVGTIYSDGREAGTVGDIAILSFSQDKIIDAVSGGAVVMRNKKYKVSQANFKHPKNLWKDRLYPRFTYKIRFLYDFGLGKVYHFAIKKLGLLPNLMNESFYNLYSLPNWHASMASYQFRNLTKQLLHRKKIATIYLENLDKKLLLSEANSSGSVHLRFPIKFAERRELFKKIEKEKIFISDTWYVDVAPECPNAVELSNHIVNLPTHINVSEENARLICQLINKWTK